MSMGQSNWENHPVECEICNYDGEDALTKDRCIDYATHLGYYSREQIEALWPATESDLVADPLRMPEGDNPFATTFFQNYARLKSDDEIQRVCACGGAVEFVHPWFGVTGGFGAAGACDCDG